MMPDMSALNPRRGAAEFIHYYADRLSLIDLLLKFSEGWIKTAEAFEKVAKDALAVSLPAPFWAPGKIIEATEATAVEWLKQKGYYGASLHSHGALPKALVEFASEQQKTNILARNAPDPNSYYRPGRPVNFEPREKLD